MKLEEAKERCKELIKEKHANWIGLTSQEAISTILQEIEHLQKENEELKEKIIEVEKENQVQKAVIFEDSISKDKIRELIELWKPKLEETDKREEKAKTKEERVVLKCIGIRLDERIKTLQDLLKEE